MNAALAKPIPLLLVYSSHAFDLDQILSAAQIWIAVMIA
jgi:hypothetical protein